jgi:uncharacterized protein YjbI with pentapeptide repeats
LSKSNLEEVSFQNANLYQALFHDAKIDKVNWEVKSLKKAEFKKTTIEESLYLFLQRQGAILK